MATARPVQVRQWAQEHGEVGGVHASHRRLTVTLRSEGHDVRYVDTGSPSRAVRALPAVWGRRSLHLFHITRLWRAIVLAPVFAALPGRTVLVLHSGSTLAQVRRLGRVGTAVLRLTLHAYDEIWAVNDEIGKVLPGVLRDRVRVVTPFTPMPHDPSLEATARDPHAVVVATNAGLEHYHADLAVEAVRRVRATAWPDATLRILAYGHDGEQLTTLRRLVAGHPWVTLTFDSPAHEVAQVLRASAVFLRPTAWDGDSVIVREALAAGARVVASDTCPRPQGVELAALDAASLADALVDGGRPSTGAGLSTTTMLDATHDAAAVVAGR